MMVRLLLIKPTFMVIEVPMSLYGIQMAHFLLHIIEVYDLIHLIAHPLIMLLINKIWIEGIFEEKLEV